MFWTKLNNESNVLLLLLWKAASAWLTTCWCWGGYICPACTQPVFIAIFFAVSLLLLIGLSTNIKFAKPRGNLASLNVINTLMKFETRWNHHFDILYLPSHAQHYEWVAQTHLTKKLTLFCSDDIDPLCWILLQQVSTLYYISKTPCVTL